MTKGEVEYAIRKAQSLYDIWNDVTGVPAKGCSWYYETLSIIEDAVRIGAKVATDGINADLSDIVKDYE